MSSKLTYISATRVSTYVTLDALKIDIIKTLARWFSNYYVYNEHALESWVQMEGTDVYVLYGTFQFELFQVDTNVYELTMYAAGSFRRQGSSCDYFERVFDGLKQQLKHPSPPFATMLEAFCSNSAEDCIDFGTPLQYTHSNSVSGVLPVAGVITESVVYDEAEDAESLAEVEAKASEQFVECERCCGWGCSTCNSACGYTRSENCANEDSDNEDEDSDNEVDEDSDNEVDEDEDIMSMNLRDMTDVQIDKYNDLKGLQPRDECNVWSMNYEEGAPIIRYSYVKFANLAVENQRVSNVTITRAQFLGTTFRNFVFEHVHFYECDFKSVVLENVTFNNCYFIDCDLDSYISLDNSCIVENFDYEEEMRQAFLEDNVTYSFY
jgi:uncharacterized protein YjbI with pentapeptide repeats